jgi:hypothetical protein
MTCGSGSFAAYMPVVSLPGFAHSTPPSVARRLPLLIAGCVAVLLLASAQAQDPASGTPETRQAHADELSRQATDPTASLKAYTFLYTQTTGFHGASSSEPDEQTVLKFQPVIPFQAFGYANILRLALPYQVGGRGQEGGSNFTLFDLIVIPESWGRLGVGPVMTVDTTGHAPDRIVLGPAIGGVMPLSKKLNIGLFNQNVFGGDTAISQLQPIIAYQLGGGWSLSAGDLQFAYDWKSGRWVNAPIGLQLGKVLRLGKLPVRLAVNPQYNLIDDAGLPQGSVIFSFTALFP